MDRTRHVDGAWMVAAVDEIARNDNWNHPQGRPLNTSNDYCSHYCRVEKRAKVYFRQSAGTGECGVKNTSSSPWLDMDRTRP